MEKKEGKKEAPDILFTSSFQKKASRCPVLVLVIY